MKEIKFRAWDEDNQVLEVINLTGSIEAVRSLLDSYCDYFYDDYFKDNPKHLMQYTGLKDKNGVEIYEGDIVKLPSHAYASYGVISWDTSWAGFYIKLYEESLHTDGAGFDEYGNDELEVIGNIYENPELLEGA